MNGVAALAIYGDVVRTPTPPPRRRTINKTRRAHAASTRQTVPVYSWPSLVTTACLSERAYLKRTSTDAFSPSEASYVLRYSEVMNWAVSAVLPTPERPRISTRNGASVPRVHVSAPCGPCGTDAADAQPLTWPQLSPTAAGGEPTTFSVLPTRNAFVSKPSIGHHTSSRLSAIQRVAGLISQMDRRFGLIELRIALLCLRNTSLSRPSSLVMLHDPTPWPSSIVTGA